MAKPLTSWLVSSFSQHNLRLVVLGRCLHVSVTKFQDKFANLQQVNSPNSWNKFQICCTDIYLIRFLPNFAVFCVFLWISQDSRLRDCVKYQKPWLCSLHVHVYLNYKCTSSALIGQVWNRAKKSCIQAFFWARSSHLPRTLQFLKTDFKAEVDGFKIEEGEGRN